MIKELGKASLCVLPMAPLEVTNQVNPHKATIAVVLIMCEYYCFYYCYNITFTITQRHHHENVWLPKKHIEEQINEL